MPRVESKLVVDIAPELAFAVSQTHGPVRLRWDPFVKEQHFLDGAEAPAKGVQTFTRSRHGFTMVSEYVSFDPPNRVGMKMVTGPPFFERFGGGWSFTDRGDGSTEATWRYTFTIRPGWLAPLADRLGKLVLGRDIERRIAGFARGCTDPEVLEAARRAAEQWAHPDRPDPN